MIMDYSISFAARYLSVSVSTLRRWDRNGKLKAMRSLGGHRRYKKSQLAAIHADSPIFNEESETEITQNIAVAVYARVSTHDQMNHGDLDRQVQRCVAHAKKTFGTKREIIIIKESASGLNAKRTGLWRLIKLADENKISDVICTFPDRITRFGEPYLEYLFKKLGVTLHYINDLKEETGPNQLLHDMMSLIASFSGKYYRSRVPKKTKSQEQIENEIIKRYVDKFSDETIKKLTKNILKI